MFVDELKSIKRIESFYNRTHETWNIFYWLYLYKELLHSHNYEIIKELCEFSEKNLTCSFSKYDYTFASPAYGIQRTVCNVS